MAELTSQGRTDLIRSELARISEMNAGQRVTAETVVEWAARHPQSALHSKFEWDDSKAAHEYRISQARGIIKVYVTLIRQPETGVRVVHPDYVSLSDERGQGGGYQPVVEVLSDEQKRYRWLLDTIKRLASIKEVSIFPELAGVKAAIEVVQERYTEEKMPKLEVVSSGRVVPNIVEAPQPVA